MKKAPLVLMPVLVLLGFSAGLNFVTPVVANFYHPYTYPEFRILCPAQNVVYHSNVPMTLQIALFGMKGPYPEAVNSVAYSLDGKPYVPIAHIYPNSSYGPTLYMSDVLSDLKDGAHALVVHGLTSYGIAFGGNVTFTVDSNTIINDGNAPRISILYPVNANYEYFKIQDDFLTFWVNNPLAWARFSLDNQRNVTVNGNATLGHLSDIATGPHTLTMCVIDHAGNVASDTVHFNVVLSVASVTLVPPRSQTYTTKNITFSFTETMGVQWSQFILDSKPLYPTYNHTITNLTDGQHSMYIQFRDYTGNWSSTETVYFTIAEPFPTILVAAASGSTATVIGFVAFAVHLKKRKNQTRLVS